MPLWTVSYLRRDGPAGQRRRESHAVESCTRHPLDPTLFHLFLCQERDVTQKPVILFPRSRRVPAGASLSCLTRPTSVSPECEQLFCSRLLSAAPHHFFSPGAALRPSRCPAGACIRVHVVGGRVPVLCLCRQREGAGSLGSASPRPRVGEPWLPTFS